MGLEIRWTKRAAKGYAKILNYLDENWTKKEVFNFEIEVKNFFELLSKNPNILAKSAKVGFRRGPINKYTLVTYRVDTKNGIIAILSIRAAKQKPLK